MSDIEHLIAYARRANSGDVQGLASNAEAELSALRRQLAEALEALKPFASIRIGEHVSDDFIPSICKFTVADLRRAAAVLAKGEQK